MKFLIILLLSSACTTSAQQVPGTVKFLAEDAKLRREGVSYSSSVVHQNPKYPDQRAESTVKVDLHSHRPKQSREVQNKPNAAYQNTYLQKRPKALPTYNQNFQQSFLRQPSAQYAVEEKIPQPNQLYPAVQSPPYNPTQSQSFNVGYSVSFTGNSKPQTPRTFPRQRLENAEIITGSRKDIVRKPNSEFEADDFVNNALIDLKKQKISGIKPKPYKFSGNKDNDAAKSFINNLAPKTQQYLSYLGDTKPTSASNTRFRQQLQSNDAQNTPIAQALQSSWTNLSPSVEFYHSRDVPQQQKFTPKQQQEQSQKFNHAAALGKSLGFDYTNALEGQTDKNQPVSFQHENVAANALGTENSQSQIYNDVLGNVAINTLAPFTNTNPLTSLGAVPVVPLNSLQLPQNSEDLQGLPKQVPLLQAQATGAPPKFPIDMSLIRDPILATSGKNLPSDPHTIAIPFDTTLLQAMQQKLAASAQLNEALVNDASKGQVQTLQGNAGIVGQQFQGQLENLQVQSLQGLKQDVFQDQGYQQFQGQQLQQPQQFNMYGIPQQQQQQQQQLFVNKGFDQYFDKYFDKMQPQESRFESATMRYPKINNNVSNNNNRLRPTNSVEIHTDLQPPPMKITRHRRMFKGK